MLGRVPTVVVYKKAYSVSEANLFSRIVSIRKFFGPALFLASVCAVAASVCLAALILCVGGIAGVIQGRLADEGQTGLQFVLEDC